MLGATFGVLSKPQLNRVSMYMSGHFFINKCLKGYKWLLLYFSVLELPAPKHLLICSNFLPILACLFSKSFLLLKKRIICSVIIIVHGFLKAISVAGSWVSKMAIKQIKQLLSTAQDQTVPIFKQMRLKLTSKQASFAVDEYYSHRQNSNSCRKEKPFEN